MPDKKNKDNNNFEIEKKEFSSKWTAEKIEQEIKEVMWELQIDYMPSQTQIKEKGTSGLDLAIMRSGGFEVWATNLNLELSSEINFEERKREIAAKQKALIKENERIGRKAVSDAKTRKNMLTLYLDAENRKKYKLNKYYRTAEEVEIEIKRYINYCIDNQLDPTKAGLATWMDTSSDQLRYIANSSLDNRSRPLQKFNEFLLAYHQQLGLSTEGNPAYNIFYGKAALGMRETAELNINVNTGVNMQNIDDIDIEQMLETQPDDYAIE